MLNPYANGNVWYVNQVTKVNSANEELLGLGKINTKNQAILDVSNADITVSAAYATDSADVIAMTKYATKEITYRETSVCVKVFLLLKIKLDWRSKALGPSLLHHIDVFLNRFRRYVDPLLLAHLNNALHSWLIIVALRNHLIDNQAPQHGVFSDWHIFFLQK